MTTPHYTRTIKNPDFYLIENELLKDEQDGSITRKRKSEVEHKYKYDPPFSKEVECKQVELYVKVKVPVTQYE